MVAESIGAASSTSSVISSQSSSDDAKLFETLIQGIVKTGMALDNSIIGDVIESVNSDTSDAQ